jgi:hypothetical protein
MRRSSRGSWTWRRRGTRAEWRSGDARGAGACAPAPFPANYVVVYRLDDFRRDLLRPVDLRELDLRPAFLAPFLAPPRFLAAIGQLSVIWSDTLDRSPGGPARQRPAPKRPTAAARTRTGSRSRVPPTSAGGTHDGADGEAVSAANVRAHIGRRSGERRSVVESRLRTAGVDREWRKGRRDCGRAPVGVAGGDVEVYGCRGLS